MSTHDAPRAISAVQLQLRILLGIAAVVGLASMALAFTHMHDWTIDSVDEALVAVGSTKRTSDWAGWANAVISELLPVAAGLLISVRSSQKRPTGVPVAVLVVSIGISLVAQLSATGVTVPYAAQFLVCLPALSFGVLAKLAVAELSFMISERETRAAELARTARAAAELARREAARRAELSAAREREAAELAAELKRREVEQAAELAREQFAAQVAAEQQRAELDAQASIRRAEVEAADRAADRAAVERREAREAEARRAAEVAAAELAAQSAAEVARIAAEAEAAERRAQAAQVAADAEVRKQTAAALAARTAAHPVVTAESAGERKRQRLPREQTEQLVLAVLRTLPASMEQPAVVAAVAERLDYTPDYSRQFVRQLWPLASSAPSSVEGGGETGQRRHLSAVAAS